MTAPDVPEVQQIAELVRSQHTGRLHFSAHGSMGLTLCARRIAAGERVGNVNYGDFSDQSVCGTCVWELLTEVGLIEDRTNA